MNTNQTRAAVCAVAIFAFGATPLAAQTVQGGTSGGITQGDLSVGTSGSGTVTTTPDGRSIGISGGGTATAADGGTASTESAARLNERRAMQRSTAQARDEDERATSRTRTMVTPQDTVRSRTVTRYKERGEAPVREMTTTVTTPEGTTTRTK